jgi:2-methylcitrate dehydratase
VVAAGISLPRWPAHQIHTRLSDVAPVRAKGFDHTTQGAYAVAAGAARALRLDESQTANAIAIAGTANNALRVTRTGELSHWKGLAYPQVAKEGVHAALLARMGITGPRAVFEGNKGFKDTIAGPFVIDWAAEDLEAVRRTSLKKHNAEIHSQSAIDAALDIASRPGFVPDKISQVRITTFQVAYDIIGGGEEGDKQQIRTKEEADHSLPYMIAVALLDRAVQPPQYEPDRILAEDVQQLLKRVIVRPDPEYSARFPAQLPARVEVEFDNGTTLNAETSSYQGFYTTPMEWDDALAKFDELTGPFASASLRRQLAAGVADLNQRPVTDLTSLLRLVDQNKRGDLLS